MNNDRFCDGNAMPEGLYVYRNVRTRGVWPMNMERTRELLCEASREIFGRNDVPDTDTLVRRTATLLKRGNYPAHALSYVTIRCFQSGETVILGHDVLPYPHPGLRSLFPQGVVVGFDVPFERYPSSASEAMWALARIEAARQGAQAVLRRDARGLIVAAEASPLFVVAGNGIVYPSSTPDSVEAEHALHAIAAAGLTAQKADIDETMLAAADEIFYADHRGITALHALGPRRCMHLTAERIAKQL